jgi:HNH endonuclease
MKEIPIGHGFFAFVDDEDFKWLSQWKWCWKPDKKGPGAVSRRGYLGPNQYFTIYMHRVIMNAPDGMQVDHKDGNVLNNQKSNLRICTIRQNRQNSKRSKHNSSGYKGVVFHKRQKKWNSAITHNGKTIHLGCFDNKEDAARAYDEGATRYFGEFARTNHN